MSARVFVEYPRSVRASCDIDVLLNQPQSQASAGEWSTGVPGMMHPKDVVEFQLVAPARAFGA